MNEQQQLLAQLALIEQRVSARLARIEKLVFSLSLNHATWSLSLMATVQELEATIADLQTAGAEARADAVRHEAKTTQAVGLLQDLSAAIADLVAQGATGLTQAALDDLQAKAAGALADLSAANTQRDAADDALDAGITANTPTPPANP